MSIVDIQEKLIGAQKEFIDALEDAIKRVEQEIKEAFEASSKLRALIPQNLKALKRGYEEVYKAE